jgi:hypothetical protein
VLARLVSEVADGDATTLVGRVAEIVTPLEAPFTGRRGAFFEAEVNQLCCDGVRFWLEERWRERATGDFILADASGSAWIETQGALVTAPASLCHGTFRRRDPRARRFLREKGWRATNLGWDEVALCVGSHVVVRGIGRAALRGGAYRRMPTRLVLRAAEVTELLPARSQP